ncbi:MAG: ParB N-terminal domain-containing protein [Armatimonadetes bacterium]|nr:ParB N-terminal domain-containing protein [Armatimonadota bacterium]
MSDLIPLPHNSRRGDIPALAESLRRFGQRKPIVIDGDQVIIAGNHIYPAAALIDATEIAVVSADDLSVEDRRAYVARAGERGPDRLRAAEEVVELVPENKPALAGLFVDDENRLWVRRTTPEGEGPRYDVFSRDGNFLGAVRPDFLPAPYFPPRVRNGRFYTIVLDELDVYEEALERERSARNIKVDPDEVWGTSAPDADDDDDEAKSAEKDGGGKSKGSATDDTKSLERQDAFQRMFSPSGAIVTAILDAEHWLCAGASPSANGESKLPVMVTGSNVFLSKYPVRTPVRLADADDLRLSGLLWPEARARMANSAYVTVERVGNGQIILFASDPFFRGYFEATGRLFLNAMLHGPGLGARQSVPW